MTSRREFLRQVTCVSGLVLVRDAAASTAQAPPFAGVNAGEERVVEQMRLCWCPRGKFRMGSPAGESGRRADEAQVDVTLTRGFWMAKYEVTQAQWRAIAGDFPGKKPSAEFGDGDDVPAYWINFAGAETFCRKLTERARRTAALPTDWEFRLPTEAQWEYACRAGTTTATAFGDQLGRHQANFAGEPLNGGPGGPAPRRATKAGSYPANAWGICDMHGNIFEWCSDWYHARLPGGTNPDLSGVQGVPNRDGTYSRVRRGGAWNDPAVFCRSALRLRYEPERDSDHIGFRVAGVQV